MDQKNESNVCVCVVYMSKKVNEKKSFYLILNVNSFNADCGPKLARYSRLQNETRNRQYTLTASGNPVYDVTN